MKPVLPVHWGSCGLLGAGKYRFKDEYIDSDSLDSMAKVVMLIVILHPVQNVQVVAPQLAQLLFQLLDVALEIRCFQSSARLISCRLQYHDVSELLGPWPLRLQQSDMM